MRYVIITLMVLLASREAAANRWPDGQIDIVISPEADAIEPGVIEWAFLEWNDIIDADITLNFVYAECNAVFGINCVKVVETEDVRLARTMITSRDGTISDADIKITSGYRFGESGYNFRNLMLHEVGHFFGAEHSDVNTDVMFSFLEIDETDKTISSANATELAGMYTRANGCSVAPVAKTTSIWGLIF